MVTLATVHPTLSSSSYTIWDSGTLVKPYYLPSITALLILNTKIRNPTQPRLTLLALTSSPLRHHHFAFPFFFLFSALGLGGITIDEETGLVVLQVLPHRVAAFASLGNLARKQERTRRSSEILAVPSGRNRSWEICFALGYSGKPEVSPIF
jgi:hypothetical protein